MAYAFTFDASACSGCKACQVACKDKNNLPAGVLWRRVYEISGGTWQNQGQAWATDVFAYNLSIACNHCVHPKCAGVCPTDAYVVRPDGIVYIDESKCMGCGYCAWACPYSAPRYNPQLGHMTKCNFCYDNLDAGQPPACVAACPMRVLDFTVISDQPTVIDKNYEPLWEKPGTEHPFPLPVFSRTQPHLALKPHAAMTNGLERTLSNREEIDSPGIPNKPRAPFAMKELKELPLILFTLCGQMAAGMCVFSLLVPTPKLQPLAIGFLLVVAAIASLLHLGTPLNAWRALNHLQKSWLSREILAFGLFGASWLAWMLERWFLRSDFFVLLAALAGLGLVHAMAQVYRIKAVPGWNTWRTNAAFFLSAASLGLLGIALRVEWDWAWLPLWAALAAEAWLALSGPDPARETVHRLRLGCLILALLAVGMLPVAPQTVEMWLPLPISLLILAEELLGRWVFYEETHLRVM